MIEKFLPRTGFDSYEDFKANYRLNVPGDFNFAYDVIDEWAKDPEKPALVWVNDGRDERRYTFKDLSEYSCRMANFFTHYGVKKGDFVLLVLKQRVEAWVCMLALHRIVDERVEALEFLASPSTRHLGETLLQITLKPDILIACINRKGRIIIPKGDDTIEPGDTLIVVTTADRMIVDLNDIFADAPERLAAVQ